MNHLTTTKQFFGLIFLLLVSCTLFAQAKLNINAINVNVGAGVFLSTNDIAVSGTSLLIARSTLKVANSITSANAINVKNGTVDMNGVAAQQIPADAFTDNKIKNLTISGSDNVTVGGPLVLTHVLTVSGGSLTSDGNLTLQSIDTITARVAPITTNAAVPVIGNVIVERYITSKRAFRFLTAPVNTPGNIRANWMENTNNPTIYVNNNPNPGYGTHITGILGNVNGFDATITNNPSLFTYNNQTQAWVDVVNTNGTLHAGEPFRVMVRGSRSTNTNLQAPPSSVTTLRARGTLSTRNIVMATPGGGGTAGMPELSSSATGYSFVANPYASPVDWELLEKTNLSGTIYIWDATLNGTNGRGAYVEYNSATGINNIDSKVDNNLQSGQAFFVRNTGTNASLTFKETHKTAEQRIVFRTDHLPRISLQLLLPGQDTAGGAADGLCAYFADHFDTSVTDQDSRKFTNLDENIGILRNGSVLSIEARKPVTSNDTLPIKIWQLLQKNYSFKSVITNFATDTYLEDAYLNTSTKLANEDTSIVPFSINSDPLSFASNRFRIVFKPAVTLPVTLTDIKAYQKDKGVQVDWTVQEESNMDRYEIEKSLDARQFATVGMVKAKLAPALSSAYGWFDENPADGDNFYRIKSISKSGEGKYSRVVKVNITGTEEPSTILANANTGNRIDLQLKNVDKGKYVINLVNSAGQKLYSGNLEHSGGNANTTIKVNSLLAGGIYHLQISSGNKTYNASVVVP